MDLDRFLNDFFPGVKLAPPLFYRHPIALRFELGDPTFPWREDVQTYLNRVYNRSQTMFHYLHHPDDRMWVAVYVHREERDRALKKRTGIFYLHIRERQTLLRLSHQSITYDGEESGALHRFVLPCRVRDLHVGPLLEKLGNRDLIRPCVCHDVFFIS